MRSRDMYDPGALRSRITIERIQYLKNFTGAYEREAITSEGAWAAVKENPPMRKMDDGATQSQGEAIFVLRYRKDLNEKDAIVYNGTRYLDLKFRMLGDFERLEITATRREPLVTNGG